MDVGCGYGDSLRRIDRWALRRGLAVELTGIDLNADAVRAARMASESHRISWIHGDAYSLDPSRVDVVLSSLLTHHLEEDEIVRFLRWMEATARVGWFINDLHRMVFPYRAFTLLINVLRFHPFVQHDGLVSIRRSFVLKEWEQLCAAASLGPDVRVEAYRLARLCVGHIKR